MEKFSKLIKSIRKTEWKSIEAEAKKKKGKSETLNEILYEEYPDQNNDNTQKFLLSIWNGIIQTTAGNRDVGISRSWFNLYAAMDKVIKTLYTNENTSEGVFTKLRKPIRTKYGDASQIYIQSTHKMGVSRERAIQRREEYQNKVAEKGLNRSTLQPIYDDEIYTAIENGIQSTNPAYKAIAVMLATGSRGIEVLKVSKYSETDKSNFIKITGIAKDRSKKGYENKVLVRPLIMLDATTVIDTVKYIRENINNTGSNDDISSRYNSALNAAMKKLFPEHKLSSHKTRYIAGQMAYLLYGNNGTENIYIQQYLGHEDASTSRTYQSINVKLRHHVGQILENDIKTNISKLIIDEEKNDKEHKEFRTDINQIKNKRVRIEAPKDVAYPEYINPRTRLGTEYKLNLLTNLLRAGKRDHIYFTQKELKNDYRYGSEILRLFWKKLKTNEIKI